MCVGVLCVVGDVGVWPVMWCVVWVCGAECGVWYVVIVWCSDLCGAWSIVNFVVCCVWCVVFGGAVGGPRCSV